MACLSVTYIHQTMTMKTEGPIITTLYDSPCGTLVLGSAGDELCLCDWLNGRRHRENCKRVERLLGRPIEQGTSAVLKRTARELDEYFAGQRREFDIPLLFAGTEFQKRVWQALLSVEYGTTVSYVAIAAMAGYPAAVRAAAGAVGANAISILAPCHRVIGSNGTLTGYDGGLDAKHFLLNLEKVRGL